MDLGGVIAIAAGIEPSTLDELSARLGHLDRDGALAVVDRAVAAGTTLDDIVDGALTPVLVDVGRRWAQGAVGAAEAQAIAAIVRVALYRAAPPLVATDRRPVAVACPQGEHHELAAEMLTELLRSGGWPAILIAGGLPAADLRRYIKHHRPKALLLSCTTAIGLPGAARIISVAHDCGVGVIAGGAGFGADDNLSKRLGAAAWAPTATVARRTLEQWDATAPELPLGMAPSDEHLRFEAQLPRLRAAGLDALRTTGLRRSDDFAYLTVLRDHLDLLLAHLGAAVLMGDAALLVEHLSQRLAFWRHRGLDGAQLLLTVDAVRQSLPGTGADGAARFLDEGRRLLRGQAATPAPTPPATAASPAFSVGSMAGPDVAHGQVFADLLFLAATSCNVPFALISVAQGLERWTTLSYGVDRRDALDDHGLFAAVASGPEPVEIDDLSGDDPVAGSLASGPLAVRFVYGIALRDRRGSTVGVLCILDRRARPMTGRQRQALDAVARQFAGQLALWRRSPTAAVPPADSHQTNRPRTNPRRGPDAARENLMGLRQAGVEVDSHLLRSHEVAVLFDVTERTVINWAASAKLASIRTAGGHLRFRSEDVMRLLDRNATRAGSARPKS